MRSGHDPEGTRLPIKLDSTSNGEFARMPLSRRNRVANDVARQNATRNARRTGLSLQGLRPQRHPSTGPISMTCGCGPVRTA